MPLPDLSVPSKFQTSSWQKEPAAAGGGWVRAHASPEIFLEVVMGKTPIMSQRG